ncbi:mitochondrial import translocase, subunit Tom22 [Cylindrobasidium torrendii FP15055 ss-10]|uniref:Mitochondrial import translocase, subunit Tom22 n=1 Tax=Cylindrobasidium torrendii FP15055 ss-10 TaxID=1314674 RepID=A0A0D7BA64_9AGAR|nr:mitochondrial import translocase, subunit Tom22 [Cylindrobasidium torrendii FP15055 ss-10]
MVKVEIIDEKEDGNNSPYSSGASSASASTDSLSSVESDASADETLVERLAALVDIVPPTTRHTIASRVSKTASLTKRAGKVFGNFVWVITTSALLVALPLALALEDEAKVTQTEKEMLEQQNGANQMLAPGQPGQLVPPGF